MQIKPVAQGSGVPGNDNSLGQTDPDRIARAKMIASGQIVPAQTGPSQNEPSSGDKQVDRIRKIKMKTNQSVYRDLPPVETVAESPQSVAESPISTNNEDQGVQTEETRPISPQFAALAKQRRALQVKEREIAQREEALKAQAPAEQQVDWKVNLKANPLSVLQEAGVTYDQLTEAILANQNGQNIDPIKLRAEIKEELKKELSQEFTTRDTQAEQQVLADMRREVNNLTAEGEDFEAIRLANQQPAVVDLIHRTWKQTGEVMDVKEAAELVENQLIEEALPFAKTKKVQSRLTPAQEAQAAAQIPAPQPKPGVQVMRTLTNRVSNTAAPLDRKARAMAAFNGTLKR